MKNIKAKIETQIVINASPEKVWRVFMDFNSYPTWNPFIVALGDLPQVGERLAFTGKIPGGMAMKFRPIVLKAEENREFRWVGHLLVPGIFDGEHSFTFESVDGKTLFKQDEHFGGFLPRLMGGMLQKSKQGFELMNQALKRRVEENRSED